jgi:hypothetical protein
VAGSDVRLSDEEFSSLQRYVDAIIDRLAEYHLSVVIETDFSALYRFMSTRHGAIVNTTFNPFESDLHRDSYWLRVIDGDGETVACHAQRIFVVANFCDLVRSGRLFSNTWEPLDPARTELVPPTMLLQGRVAYAGSLWVNNEHRGKGLAVWLPYLSRLACLRNYEPDFFTACVFEKIAASGVPARYYGYTHVEPLLHGYSAVTGKNDTMYICYMPWRDAVSKIRLLALHPQYPIDPDQTG